MQTNRHQWDDKQLIAACLAGDEHAWDTLITRYRRLIYAIPLRFGFSEMVADEVFQDVCVTLLNKLHQVKNQDRFAAWLTTLTKRTCLNYIRRTKETTTLDEFDLADTSDSIETSLVDIEQMALVRDALGHLSERCQSLLRVLFLREKPLPYETVATQLGISKGSIGPTRIRCLANLRKAVLSLSG